MRLKVVIFLVLLAACSEEVLLPVHRLSNTTLFFDPAHRSTTMYVRNTGQAPLSWSVQVLDDFIAADPMEGNVNPGDSVAINLTVDFGKLTSQQLLKTSIKFTMPDTFDEQVLVDILNFTEEKFQLNDLVIDAEYNRTRDILVLATKSNKLIILDPETQKISTVKLEFTPVCVSISPDGKYAAVGHHGVITFVNLQSLTVEKKMGLTFSVFDLVLTNSGWAYLVPADEQWTNIHAVNFNSGEDKRAWGSIYSNSFAKLHPGGHHIYTATTNSSPSDFLNFEINDGIVSEGRDSPYHGDYDFGGDLWFADDGEKVFARSGNVFSTSDDPDNDLIFINNISIDSYLRIQTLDHSSVANRVYAVIEGINDDYYPPPNATQVNEVRKYDLDYTELGSIPLEYFVTEDNAGATVLAKAEGVFGFFNSKGTKFFVVVKTGVQVDQIYTDVKEKWGVVSIDVD